MATLDMAGERAPGVGILLSYTHASPGADDAAAIRSDDCPQLAFATGGVVWLLVLLPFVSFAATEPLLARPLGGAFSPDPIFAPPQPAEAPPDLRGLVMRGYSILRDTPAELPDVVGNDLSCTNCHFGAGLRDGTENGGISLVGVGAKYPIVIGTNAIFTCSSANGVAIGAFFVLAWFDRLSLGLRGEERSAHDAYVSSLMRLTMQRLGPSRHWQHAARVLALVHRMADLRGRGRPHSSITKSPSTHACDSPLCCASRASMSPRSG